MYFLVNYDEDILRYKTIIIAIGLLQTKYQWRISTYVNILHNRDAIHHIRGAILHIPFRISGVDVHQFPYSRRRL